MPKRGGQPGNQNATKGRLWTAAINRALDIWDNESRFEGKQALDALAMELLSKCAEGDLQALKELGDRLEGRPAQSLTVGGDPENPLVTVNHDRPKVSKEEWMKSHGIEKTG